ncbi:MAG: hypothetical protein KC731_35010, partial [Myxococcales bacterium]|nr:hypothetical protein [Myxococcales bacterium]
DRDAPSEIDKDAARTLVQQGDELMDKGEYHDALVAYRRADDIMGVPTTSIEVGKVAELLGRLVEARTAYEVAAAYPVKDGEPEPFTRARDLARDKVAELNERIPRLKIRVKGLALGAVAQVTADGEEVDVKQELRLDPGSHEIEVTATDHVTVSERVSLEEYELTEVELETKVSPVTLWPMAYVGLGMAGLAAVVGSITGGLSLKDASEAKRLCSQIEGDGCPESASEPLSRSRTLAHVSTASFIVAGVAAAVGVTGLVLSLGADDSEEAARLELELGPAYLGLSGTF